MVKFHLFNLSSIMVAGVINKLHFSRVERVACVVLVVIGLFSMAMGADVTVAASSYTGAPGDKITFTWSFSGGGSKYVVFDGIRKEDAFINSGSYIWTAEPGTHLMNVILRPSGGGDHIEKQAVVEISGNEGTFSHPGVYSSQKELEEVRRIVNGSAPHPVKKGWDLMKKTVTDRFPGYKGIKYTTLDWVLHPYKIVKPQGNTADKWAMFDDGRAAYAHALQWVVTEDQRYADKAIALLDAWGSTFEKIECTDHYLYLFNSWICHTWIAAAEIIRHYKISNGSLAGWKEVNITEFENSMAKYFELILLRWQGSNGLYNGINQPAAVVRSMFAIGVFLNDPGLFKIGTDFLFEYKHTKSQIVDFHKREVNFVEICIADDGEDMELNRDYGHGTGTLNCISGCAEILRQQREHIDYSKYNLYEYRSNDVSDPLPRLLMGAKYCAYTQRHDGSGLSINPNSSRNDRKGHYQECVLNYYKHISKDGFTMPLVEKVAELARDRVGIAYTAAWTALTHADLYKDMAAVGTVLNSAKLNKSLFTLRIKDNKMLVLNYTSGKNATVKLFTPAGRMIKSVFLNEAKSVSLKGFNHGLYIVKLQVGDVTETKKLLLK